MSLLFPGKDSPSAQNAENFDVRLLLAGLVVIGLFTIFDYVVEHPLISLAIGAFLAAVFTLAWFAMRPVKEPDPGQHRHYDGIQVLKILALANNRIDQSDRDIVGAYMRTVPDNLLSVQVAELMVSADLPSPMDLDRHIDAARDSLNRSELRTLVEHVRMMRGAERRLTPVTREWFDRTERRLMTGGTRLDPGQDALGLEDRTGQRAPLLDGILPLTAVERFDDIVMPLRDQEDADDVRHALARLREPMETLEGVQTDDEAEDALNEILDRQLAGVMSSYLSVLALRDPWARQDARSVLIRSVERLTVAVDGIVSRLTADALSRLDTVGRYIDAKNPTDPLERNPAS